MTRVSFQRGTQAATKSNVDGGCGDAQAQEGSPRKWAPPGIHNDDGGQPGQER